jgi:hypothetical protein
MLRVWLAQSVTDHRVNSHRSIQSRSRSQAGVILLLASDRIFLHRNSRARTTRAAVDSRSWRAGTVSLPIRVREQQKDKEDDAQEEEEARSKRGVEACSQSEPNKLTGSTGI